MKRNALLALAITISLSSLPVRGQDQSPPDDTFTAQALKDACSTAPGLDQNAKAVADQKCQSYLQGLTDGMFVLGLVEDSGKDICMSKDEPVSPAEAKAAFESYLAEHPDTASHAAGLVVAFGIFAGHSCE